MGCGTSSQKGTKVTGKKQAVVEHKEEKRRRTLYTRRMSAASRAGCSLADFAIEKQLGYGAYSKVYRVRKHSNGRRYAMKVLEKAFLMEYQLLEMAARERSILAALDSPFLCRLHYAFQDEHRLYLAMDYISGGEVFWHLHERQREPTRLPGGQQIWGWPEEQVRLYVAELVLALDYLHNSGIIYRDLKAENVLLTEDGHAAVVDFGLSVSDLEESMGAGGTLEYLPPEVLTGQASASTASDWWALGVLTWEMLAADQPFGIAGEPANVHNPAHLRELTKQIYAELVFPGHFSQEVRSLLRAILEVDPQIRMGTQGGAEDFKSHPFFAGLDWEAVAQKKVTPVYQPGDVVEAMGEDDGGELVELSTPPKGGVSGTFFERFLSFSRPSFSMSPGTARNSFKRANGRNGSPRHSGGNHPLAVAGSGGSDSLEVAGSGDSASSDVVRSATPRSSGTSVLNAAGLKELRRIAGELGWDTDQGDAAGGEREARPSRGGTPPPIPELPVQHELRRPSPLNVGGGGASSGGDPFTPPPVLDEREAARLHLMKAQQSSSRREARLSAGRKEQEYVSSPLKPRNLDEASPRESAGAQTQVRSRFSP